MSDLILLYRVLVQHVGTVISQPGNVIQQPGILISQPGNVNPQPGHVISQPGSVIFQPGYVIQQPGLVISQPGHIILQSGIVNPQPGCVILLLGHTNLILLFCRSLLLLTTMEMQKRALTMEQNQGGPVYGQWSRMRHHRLRKSHWCHWCHQALTQENQRSGFR